MYSIARQVSREPSAEFDGYTSCQCLPFTRFTVLALRKPHAQHLEAVFHLATTLPFRQFVRDPQLGGSTVWCAAV